MGPPFGEAQPLVEIATEADEHDAGSKAKCEAQTTEPGRGSLVDSPKLVWPIDVPAQTAIRVTTGVARTQPMKAIAKISSKVFENIMDRIFLNTLDGVSGKRGVKSKLV